MFPSLVHFAEPLFRGDDGPPPGWRREVLRRTTAAVHQDGDAVAVRARRQGLVGTQAGAAAAVAAAAPLDDEQQERRGQHRGARPGAQVVAAPYRTCVQGLQRSEAALI